MNYDEIAEKCGKLKMKTILIVDDDEKFCKLIRRILENENYVVIEARNGNEGISRYKSTMPDMVMVDIIMPEKHGLDTIQEIKKINNKAKIIAVSGGLVFTPETYLEEAKSLGVTAVLAKPFAREKLLSSVNTILNEK